MKKILVEEVQSGDVIKIDGEIYVIEEAFKMEGFEMVMKSSDTSISASQDEYVELLERPIK